jgi:isopentenyl diphosphate isomerase/L-lactate dehydrogenase-like FMN-dependent dehydrogenase
MLSRAGASAGAVGSMNAVCGPNRVLDPEDARTAVKMGMQAMVVSNHGGRQLDGALSTAASLPAVAGAVKGNA